MKFSTFIDFLLEYSIPLIAGVLLALLFANIAPESYAIFLNQWPHPAIPFSFIINDLFMVFFFGLVTTEIVQNGLPGGHLHPLKKAINPIFGTVGGVVMPIAVYLIYVAITGEKSLLPGWGISTATDIALAYLVACVAFGKNHPAVSFLLLLAIADDGIGLFIIALFYPNPAHPARPLFLLLVVIGMVIVYFLRKKQVGSFWPYLFTGGSLSWLGLYFAGIHPALALVPIIPFLPAGHNLAIAEFVAVAGQATPSLTSKKTAPLDRFEIIFKTPVMLGLIGFGLANAGVSFSAMGPATWAVLLSLIIGKTAGIFIFSFVAIRLGFPLPSGMTLRTLFVASMTAAMGMTVALFVAGVAFTDPALQGAAKMGALFSAGIAPIVLIVAKQMRVKGHH
ncbi:MAG: Na+/H+ antiporter NhaA [Nitrospirota bacterium]